MPIKVLVPRSRSHIQASACCKHYVANSMDGTTEKDGEHHDRNHVDSIVTMQDLIDSYMMPFQVRSPQTDGRLLILILAH
eukprot:COSAG03_NODE_9144_length_743_cov_0.989130_1_plen_80_part_00